MSHPSGPPPGGAPGAAASPEAGDRRRRRTLAPAAAVFPRAVPTYVGRAAELDRGAALLADETLHLVYGVAGVGKSEFVYKLIERGALQPGWAQAPALLVQARAGDTVPQLLATVAAQLGVRRPRAGLAAARAAEHDDELALVAARLDAAPVVLFLDDLHHLAGGDELGEALGYLSRHVRASRVLVASRVELRLPPGAPTPVIHRLGPLDPDDTAQLVRRLAERRGEVAPDPGAVFARSRGNPFLVLRTVAGEAAEPASGLDQTLRELSAAARALLRAVAVARGALAPEDVADEADALGELTRRFLVDGRARLTVHDLVADAVARASSRRERAIAHREVADRLAARGERAGRLEPLDAVAVVHHLTGAGDAEQAWEDCLAHHRAIADAGLDHLLLDDLRELAGLVADREPVALLVARILVRRSHITAAADVLAALGDRGAAAPVRWLLLSGEVAQRRGRMRDAEALFRRARAAARTPADRLRAALELSDVSSLSGRGDDAREVLASARAEHGPLGARDQGRWAWSLALSFLMQERFPEAASAARAGAAAIAGAGLDDLEALLRVFEVLGRAESDELDEAQRVLGPAPAAAPGGVVRERVVRLYRAVLLHHRGQCAEALAALDDAWRHFGDHADVILATVAGYYRGRARLATGDAAAACDLAAALTQAAIASELESMVPRGRALQAEALLVAGRAEDAREQARAVLAAPRVSGRAAAAARAVLAELAALDGDLAAARAELDAIPPPAPASALVADHDPAPGRAAEAAWLDLQRAWLELLGGDASLAAAAAGRARAHLRRVGRADAAARAAALRGLALLCRGGGHEVAEAEVMLAEAAAQVPLDEHRRVRALCLLGRAALAARRGGAPREVLAAAPGEPRHAEGRVLAAAAGDAVPLPGARALLARLGLVAGQRHRVVGRAGARVVGDDELAALRASHAVVIEPARAVITALVHGAPRTDRGRPLACELLAVLVEAQGAVLPAEQLFLTVWGAREYHPLRHRNTLYVAVKRLRATLRALLDDDREVIETAAGGWRVIDELDAVVVRPEGEG